MKTLKKIGDLFKLFFGLLQVNTLTRLITSVILAAICLKLSEYWNLFWYLAIIFAIYPVILTLCMFIFAWILNPIRDFFPESRFTKRIMPFLDNLVNKL